MIAWFYEAYTDLVQRIGPAASFERLGMAAIDGAADHIAQARLGTRPPSWRALSDEELTRWLAAIDLAASEVNPLQSQVGRGVLSEPWQAALDLYRGPGSVAPGWFYRHPDGGGVTAAPGNRLSMSPDLLDAFTFLRVVPPEHGRRTAIVPGAELIRDEDFDHIRVGTFEGISYRAEAPLITVADTGRSWYWVEPRVDEDEGRRRIDRALAALDRHDCTIGLGPEATLTPEIVQWWLEAIAARAERLGQARDRARAKGGPTPEEPPLRYVVAGTLYAGPGGADRPHASRAVVIDAREGTVHLQGKRSPIELSTAEIEAWGHDDAVAGSDDATIHLESILGDDATLVVDLPPRRIAILVCEDLKRLDLHMRRLATLGVTTALVPIMSSDLFVTRARYGWEARSAKWYTEYAGSEVVVANSRILDARSSWRVTSFSTTPPPRVGYGPAGGDHQRRDGEIAEIRTLVDERPITVHELVWFRGPSPVVASADA